MWVYTLWICHACLMGYVNNRFENFFGKHIRELFWKTDMRMVLENKSKNSFDLKMIFRSKIDFFLENNI